MPAAPMLGLYRVLPVAGRLVCSGVTGDATPDAADFEYYFQLVPNCNDNEYADPYEIDIGMAADCNKNGVLDTCELRDHPELVDINGDGTGPALDGAARRATPAVRSSWKSQASWRWRPERQLAARPKGLPSVSRQMLHRVPAWMTSPPRSRTRCSPASMSGTEK